MTTKIVDAAVRALAKGQFFKRLDETWREADLERSEGFTQEDLDRRFGKRPADSGPGNQR